jgi:hypothetical protein
MKQSPEKLVGFKAVSEVGAALAQVLDQAGAASATEVEVGVALAQAVDQVGADVLPADFHDPAGNKERWKRITNQAAKVASMVPANGARHSNHHGRYLGEAHRWKDTAFYPQGCAIMAINRVTSFQSWG